MWLLRRHSLHKSLQENTTQYESIGMLILQILGNGDTKQGILITTYVFLMKKLQVGIGILDNKIHYYIVIVEPRNEIKNI